MCRVKILLEFSNAMGNFEEPSSKDASTSLQKVLPSRTKDMKNTTNFELTLIFFGLALLGSWIHPTSADRCQTFDFESDDCAIGFDHPDCQGWEVRFKTGYTELEWLRDNEIGSLMVKPGCSLVTYEHQGPTRSMRGRKYNLDAKDYPKRLIKNLIGPYQLEGRISSATCYCSVSSEASPVLGTSQPPCDSVEFTGATACILYDQSDCQVMDWTGPIFIRDGDTRQFHQNLEPEDTKYANSIRSSVLLNELESPNLADATESVSVLKGCILELFDQPNLREGFRLTAPRDSNLHVTLARNDLSAFLSNSVQSARCYCDSDALD